MDLKALLLIVKLNQVKKQELLEVYLVLLLRLLQQMTLSMN